jgi:ADP-ribose pyrophosphatase YjhB (NUDIX family)
MKEITEEEFLKNYDSSKFEKLSMTTDICMISVSDVQKKDYRKTDGKIMSILLVKRDDHPYKNMWCLPGGFLNPVNETLEDCAKRILKKETNLENVYLEQLYTFDAINRDPRMRIVSCSYVSLVDKNKLTNPINKSACWFDVTKYIDKDNIVTIELNNGKETLNIQINKQIKEKTTDRYSFSSLTNTLAFDHDIVILSGIERIRNKLNYTDIVFNMMPKLFTLKELQQVYEVILGKKLLDPAFRRIIKDKVIKTEHMKTGEGHRPSVLFKYNNK